jgi:hypothetical protein
LTVFSKEKCFSLKSYNIFSSHKALIFKEKEGGENMKTSVSEPNKQYGMKFKFVFYDEMDFDEIVKERKVSTDEKYIVREMDSQDA